MNKIIPLLSILLIISCKNEPTHNVQGDWIKGSEEEQAKIIEKQFRGFDMAMVETGYRYQELYWAGQDENWDYAKYQVEKIEKTIKNGLERRPKRTKSADHFLNYALPEMKKIIQEKDTLSFNRNYQILTQACNSCHAMEKVPHFAVKKPLYRPSPIRK